jgi:hypothetical protein
LPRKRRQVLGVDLNRSEISWLRFGDRGQSRLLIPVERKAEKKPAHDEAGPKDLGCRRRVPLFRNDAIRGAGHRGIWPAGWLCEAVGVSRGGFYAWLTRPRSQRSRSDEELGAKVRASFVASDRTYGTRRVWKDMLAEGLSCGLHRIERLMRLQALKARPRRRRLPPDLGERQATAAPKSLNCVAA